jgi:Fe-S cluster biogenesis protein NfuA
MFIQYEETSNSNTVKFLPGKTVLESGSREFGDARSATGSPLAARLFEIDHVTNVRFDADSIAVTKSSVGEWQQIRAAVLGAIMQHYTSGAPLLLPGADPGEADTSDDADDPIAAQINDVIATRIRPALSDSGADVAFRGIEDGVVSLEISGDAAAVTPMRTGIENMLNHYVPDLAGINFVSSKPSSDENIAAGKAGLNSPQAQAIQRLLDEQVNPTVASHGGNISLIDVADNRAYILLGGGCQGCGMADVTLKQGVEVAIMEAVPSIVEVIDTTDHAGGNNPYYQGAKG